MKNFFTIITLAALTTATLSCSNEGIEPIFQPSAQGLKNLFAENLDNITQHVSFDANQNYTFISDKGVHVKFTANCIKTMSGGNVTGNVDLSFVEIFDRGTMVTTNKPTVGIQDGEPRLLQTGGEFLVKVSQNGQELKTTCGYQISAPTSLTGGTVADMEDFRGTIDNDGNLTWTEITQSGEVWTGFNQDINADAYNAFVSEFGWYNYDKFKNLGQGFTKVTFTMPSGFDSKNSHIFMASQNIPNSLSYASTNMPIGCTAYYILVCESAGKFKYAIKPLQTIVPNLQIQFSLSEMHTGNVQQLIDAVNTLP